LPRTVIKKVRESKDISSNFIMIFNIFVPYTDSHCASCLLDSFHFKFNNFVPYWLHTCALKWFCLFFGESLKINLCIRINLREEISIPNNFSADHMEFDGTWLKNSSSFIKISKLCLEIDSSHTFLIMDNLLRLHRPFVTINKIRNWNDC
jgi:hypothetical protein